MKETLKAIEDNVSQFYWQENSMLKKVTSQSECKEVFESICCEIGRFYSQFGIKAFKKKIQYKFDDYKLELQFSSSGYNLKGDFIWLEITSGIYPNKLKTYYKEQNERLLPIIFSNTNLLDYKISRVKDEGFITKGINILGEEIIKESKFNESTVEHSRGANLYNISIDEFRLILRYINRVIKKSVEVVTDKECLMEYLLNPTQRQLYWITEKRTIDYVNIYYETNEEVQSRMNDLIEQKNNPV